MRVFFIMIAYEFSHNNIHFHLFVDDALLSAINVVNCITFTKRKKHVLWTSCSWTVIDFSALLVGGGIFVPPYHLIFFLYFLAPIRKKALRRVYFGEAFFCSFQWFRIRWALWSEVYTIFPLPTPSINLQILHHANSYILCRIAEINVFNFQRHKNLFMCESFAPYLPRKSILWHVNRGKIVS